MRLFARLVSARYAASRSFATYLPDVFVASAARRPESFGSDCARAVDASLQSLAMFMAGAGVPPVKAESGRWRSSFGGVSGGAAGGMGVGAPGRGGFGL